MQRLLGLSINMLRGDATPAAAPVPNQVEAGASSIDVAPTTERRPSMRPTALPPPLEKAENPQANLKAKILEIQTNKSLTPKEKADGMQKLMMQQWNEAQERLTPKAIEKPETPITDADRTVVTYHDADKTIMGCQHYQRKCKLYAKCCNKFYSCRFCHDEVEKHTFDRYATEKISCMQCHTVQPVGKTCTNTACGIEFARYYCDVCKFYDDDPTKDIYHCEKCRICRIGKGLGIDYFHCDKCNACMSITLKKHKCVERSLESDCPICHVYMFTSTTPVMFLPCGHCMHVACYEDYTLTNYICPLCSKSLGDMRTYFARIDDLLAQEQMPPEYANYRSQIYCSDCERKSETKFHFVYHKCQYDECKSYNTKLLKNIQLPPDAAPPAAPTPLVRASGGTPTVRRPSTTATTSSNITASVRRNSTPGPTRN
ncbi:hypothetical protein SDRG_13477 [Saprolegnia diclina VS20]|uniref:RING finger and CHY zinc finger domain-containing protein 1 n=1 Tax=Saprolegnia diclina (strain VS20) TaxID=1156394 RepID=T0Q2K4_SAPDV|nr:hypothetical protein SDRG_13477 [Saprolegnia diclina VS20]EQC28796.1 hypothetical protein SDRG_13477 [Saprolegnia diclina VS20]|eukprot:XP_008617791.1 hypothetical protein SDRG_13477 [Saprolegnia diclina VS20]